MASLRQIVCLVTSAFLPFVPVPLHAQGKTGAHDSRSAKEKRTLPLVFEANQGQFPSDIGFVGKTERYSVAVEARDLRFSLPGKHGAGEVVLSFEDSQAAAPAGIAEAPFRTNYFLGSDPASYRTGIKNYTRIGLRHVYPGIDAEFYAKGNTIEHDFLLAPGAHADLLAMRVAAEGEAARLSGEGDLVIAGGDGELRLKKPVAYQVGADGKRTEVAAAFAVSDGNGAQEVRFKLGAYDHSRQLIVDPVIQYGSFFDGRAGSVATALTSDAAGDVYLTGYTASAAQTFGVAKTNMDVPLSVSSAMNGTGSSAAAVFVAKFNPSGSASPIAWLNYFGDSVSASASTSIALQPIAQPGYVAVGGSTLSANLPTTGGAAVPSVGGSAKRGFVVSFSTADGSLAASTYIDSAPGGGLTGTTEVNGLAMDSNGNVYAVGSATGSGLPTTGNALGVDSAVLTSTAHKGFIVELTPALGTGPLVSYLSGNQVADTSLTSVALDPSGNLYVGGYTAGSFPMAGAYSAANMYTHNANDTAGNDAFAAELVPGKTGTTIKYSAWLSGSGDDKLNSLALDSSGNLYLFGQTVSPDLAVNATSTSADGKPLSMSATSQASAKPVTATFPAKQGTATTSGFAAKLDPAGQPLVTTFLGGTGDDIVTSGSVDADGLVYVAGRSSSTQTMSYAKAALLPTGQDMTAASQQHGFLLQLTNDLSEVKYIANIGGAAGPDSAVSVAVDAARQAYVGGNISSSSAYTSSTAFQATRSSLTSSSAYVAKIAPQDPPPLPAFPLTLTAVTCTQAANPTDTTTASCMPAAPQPPTEVGYPDPIGYANAANSTPPVANVTYYFTLAPPAMTLNTTPYTGVVVQIPTVANLTYDSIAMTDTTPGASNPTSQAVCSTAVVAPLLSPGCTIALYPQTASQFDDTFSLVIQAHLSSAPAAPTTLSIVPTVSDALYSGTPTATEISNVALPANLSISLQSQSPASGGTVFTTQNHTVQTSTQVSYTFQITNTKVGTSYGDATNTTFTFPASPSGFVVANATTTSTTGSCSTTTGSCTGLTITNGSSITVTVTGTYPDDSLNGNASAALTTAFSVSAAGSYSFPVFSVTPGITLQRGVHLGISASTLTSSANASGDFYLGDTLTYKVTVINDGPSATLASNNDTVTITLPTQAAFTQTGTDFTCTGTTCTATLPALAAAGTAQFTFTGSFPDSSNTAVHGTHVQTTFAVATNIASGTATDANSGTAGDTSTSFQAYVVRYASLSFASGGYTQTAAQCASTSPCLDMQNASNTGYASYSVQVSNAGPNVSENTNLTITLPSAGAGHPLLLVGSPQVGNVSGFSTAPTCTYTASSPQGTISCSGFNMAKGASFTVTGSLTADNATVPITVAFVNVAAGSGTVNVAQDAQGTPAALAMPGIEVDRVAHVVTSKTIALTGPSLSTSTPTVDLAENTSASPGVNDTLTVTLTVSTAALNAVPSAVLTDTLPNYFQFITTPKATTVNGATATCTYGDPSTTKAASLSCKLASLAPATSVANSPATQVTVTYSGKFVDNGVTGPDITGDTAATKAAKYTGGLPTASSTIALAVDPGPASDLTSAAPALTVERLVHMVLRKTRNTTGTLKTVLNLDEETGTSKANLFGAADEIEYDVAVTNGGVNQALGVQFTDVLPPYFTLVNPYIVSGAPVTPDGGGAPSGQLASGSLVCYAGTAASGTALTFPYPTGGSSQPITCTYGAPSASPANPLALAPAGSFEFVYQGKFQDNAPGADDLPLGQSSYSFSSAAGTATTTATQSVEGSTAVASAALGPYTVQRAVHLTLVMATNPVRSLDEKTVPLTLAGEAQPSSTGGTPVINCVRYKAYIQNAGPNIARQATLSATSQNGLSLTSSAFGTTTAPNTNSGTDAALADAGCVYSAASNTSATLSQPSTLGLIPLSEAPSGQTPSLVVDLDGYFGVGTLGAPNNSLAEVGLRYASLADGSSVDTSGSTFTPGTGGSITVVNTPYGGNFLVAPFSGTAQPVTLSYTSVGAPGVTTLGVNTTTAALPAGPSPVPGSSSTAINLYKTGTTSPQFYSLGTTAGAVSGTTNLCITNPTGGSALPDGFAKPERVLLWGLLNIPAGTVYGAVPNVSNLPGDITSSVTPLGAATYVQPGGPLSPYDQTHTTLPAKQPQPQRVCGNVNSFATGAAQAVFAVLEPVNFAPVITANTNSPSQTPGKGVSEVSFLFPTNFDPNNNDPCYVATTAGGTAGRNRCDDNLALTMRVFGGDALVPSQTHLVGPMTPDLANLFITQTFEVQASATIYDLVTDQLGEVIYLGANCDPGVYTNGYTAGNLCSASKTTSQYSFSSITLSATAPFKQGTDFGTGELAQLFPSLNGGSSALIILPTLAQQAQAGYVPASGTVTAGQSVGFLWRLRLDANATTGNYNLACFMVDAATQNTVVPFPAGLSCQVPSSVTLPTDIPVYIVTQGNLYGMSGLGWKLAGGAVFATLLVPFLLFRRRLTYPKQLAVLALLSLVGAAGLSGCGSGSSSTATGAVAAGTYWFRVSATPAAGGTTITSTAFSVKVVSGN